MSRITEATVIGVFDDKALGALSKPFGDSRFRQQGTLSPPFVADVLTAAFKNINPEAIVSFVGNAIGDGSAVLVIDDDHAERLRAVRFTYGAIDADTGDK